LENRFGEFLAAKQEEADQETTPDEAPRKSTSIPQRNRLTRLINEVERCIGSLSLDDSDGVSQVAVWHLERAVGYIREFLSEEPGISKQKSILQCCDDIHAFVQKEKKGNFEIESVFRSENWRTVAGEVLDLFDGEIKDGRVRALACLLTGIVEINGLLMAKNEELDLLLKKADVEILSLTKDDAIMELVCEKIQEKLSSVIEIDDDVLYW
jgi:hypothetical protein